MPLEPYLSISQPGRSAGFFLLTILAVIILILLISLVEMVILQLLRWGNTRQSLKASLVMNITSSVVALLLLVRFPQPEIRNFFIGWFLLVVIEGGVLNRISPGTPGYNWFVAAVANLVSYLILILPAFLSRG